MLVVRRRTLNAKTKKPFKAPKLKIYGDVAHITEAVGQTGMNDMGKQTMTKTSV
jgi:hypothetical protein